MAALPPALPALVLDSVKLVHRGLAMLTVNIHDAKTQLSRLVERAAGGESFMIAKAGAPLVKVVPLQGQETGTKHRLGFLVGEIRVPDDFDRMGQDEIAAQFGGQFTIDGQ